MKTLVITMAAITAFAACSSNNNSTDKKNTDSTTVATAAPLKNNNPSKGIVEHYLHIKNALAKDDGKDAAMGGKELSEAFAKFDESSLTAEQKKTYADISADAKEHAEHIGMNGDKVAHQREHFAMLSKDIYDLVKAFGSGQTLYQDYCPMYNNNKGAIWISETKDISNPYLGAKMPTCGSVKETIK